MAKLDEMFERETLPDRADLSEQEMVEVTDRVKKSSMKIKGMLKVCTVCCVSSKSDFKLKIQLLCMEGKMYMLDNVTTACNVCVCVSFTDFVILQPMYILYYIIIWVEICMLVNKYNRLMTVYLYSFLLGFVQKKAHNSCIGMCLSGMINNYFVQ